MDTTTVSVTNDLRTIRAKFVESLRLSKASISTLKLKSNDLASEISFYKNSLNRQEDVNKEQLDYIHELERKLNQQTRDAESRMETVRDDYQRLLIDHDSTKITLTEKLNEIRKLKDDISNLHTQAEICKTTHSTYSGTNISSTVQDQTITMDTETTNSLSSNGSSVAFDNTKGSFSLDSYPTLPTFTAFPEVKLFLKQIMARMKEADRLRKTVTNELRTVQTDHHHLLDQFTEIKTKTKDYLLTIQDLEQTNKLLQETLIERDKLISILQETVQRKEQKCTELDHQILTLQQSVTTKTLLVQSLQSHVQDAESTIKKRNELLSTAHDSLHLQEVALNHVRTEHLNLRKENEQLSKRVQTIDENHQKEKQDLRNETIRLNDQLASTIAEMDKSKNDYSLLNHKFHDIEHQLMECIQQRTKLQLNLLQYENGDSTHGAPSSIGTASRTSSTGNVVVNDPGTIEEKIPELLVLDTSPTVIDPLSTTNSTSSVSNKNTGNHTENASMFEVPSTNIGESNDNEASGTKRKRDVLSDSEEN